MTRKPRLLRITTVPVSLLLLLDGQLEFMTRNGFEVLAVSADGPEVGKLRERGVAHQIIPMTRKITPFRDLMSLFKMIRLLRDFRPDIVHTHTPKAGLIGMLAAYLCRVPVRIHTVAGLPLMEARGLKRRLLIIVEFITYRSATKVLANSVGLKSFISEVIDKSKPISIIGKGSSNGIDCNFFKKNESLLEESARIRKDLHLQASDIVISFVGRVVPDKGIRELTCAFKQLRKSISSRCVLLIVGQFEDRLTPLDKEVLDFLKHDSDVHLAGFKSDVRPWMLASDIFAFPSYREGFPNVVLQASALEIPCVVTNINGCNEIIEHNKTGIIVPPKSKEALFEGLVALANDREARTSFGENARRYVLKNFDQLAFWQQLLQFYREELNPAKLN